MAADPLSLVEQFFADNIQPAMDVDAMTAQMQAIRDHMESFCGPRFVLSREEVEAAMCAPIRFRRWLPFDATHSDVATFSNVQDPATWNAPQTVADYGRSFTVAVDWGAEIDAELQFIPAGLGMLQQPNSEALARSKSLLERHLSPPQLEEFSRSESFTVQVRNRGGFQITKGKVFNVKELATGELWCAGPQDVPVYDFMLAQKMTLETCPEEFFAVANRQGDLIRMYFEVMEPFTPAAGSTFTFRFNP